MLNLLKTKPALVVVLGAILVGGCNGSPRVTSRENAKPSSHLVKTQVGASPRLRVEPTAGTSSPRSFHPMERSQLGKPGVQSVI